MHKSFKINIAVIRFATILVILFSLTATSCSGRKEKVIKTHLIPEKDFIAVLTDIHMADGLLIIPKIRSWYSDRDSIKNYLDIIQSHGYTREDMDRTIRYYFIKKPKQLIKIYDEVLGKLSEMESLVNQEIPVNRIPVKNLWKGDSAYCLPSWYGNDTLQFDQQLEISGYYTLSFTLTLYPDDPSLKPRFNAYFCQPDSIETGKRDYYPSFVFLKDGRPHKYTFSKMPRSKTYTHLRGWFIKYDNNCGELERHLRIDDISFTCIPSSP